MYKNTRNNLKKNNIGKYGWITKNRFANEEMTYFYTTCLKFFPYHLRRKTRGHSVSGSRAIQSPRRLKKKVSHSPSMMKVGEILSVLSFCVIFSFCSCETAKEFIQWQTLKFDNLPGEIV